MPPASQSADLQDVEFIPSSAKQSTRWTVRGKVPLTHNPVGDDFALAGGFSTAAKPTFVADLRYTATELDGTFHQSRTFLERYNTWQIRHLFRPSDEVMRTDFFARAYHHAYHSGNFP